MRTREESKAALQRIIKLYKKDMAVMANRLNNQKKLVDDQASVIGQQVECIKARDERYDTLKKVYEACAADRNKLEQANHSLTGQLADMQLDRDSWRKDYLHQQQVLRKMRADLFDQARLAGVLALEGKGAHVSMTDNSN